MLTLAHLQQRRSRRWLFGLTLLLLVTLLVSLCAGDQWIPPGEWLSAKGQLFIWQIRLPRTLAVVLVGAALALSGAIMQPLFENPLAEPGLADCRRPAGQRSLARLGARPVRDPRRAADHLYFAAFCPPPSLYQPSAAGGGGAGDHLQCPDDLGGLLLHLF